MRFIEPRLDKSGKLELLGKCWNPDVDTWQNQIVNVPEMDPAKGDVDEFSALKRLVDDLIKSDSLSKSVSVHNFTALCSTDKPDIAHCMWPTPNSGYKAMHLLKYLEKLRWLSFYNEMEDLDRLFYLSLGFQLIQQDFPFMHPLSQ